MCPPKPKITTVAAPPPEPPIPPVQAPKAMATAEDSKRRQGGLSQLRISTRAGAL